MLCQQVVELVTLHTFTFCSSEDDTAWTLVPCKYNQRDVDMFLAIDLQLTNPVLCDSVVSVLTVEYLEGKKSN